MLGMSSLDSSTALIEIRDVAKSFGGLQVLKDFSLQVGESELLSIIGPNGCGKTTLFNVITGTLVPDAGDILVGGRNIVGLTAFEIARLGLSRKFQVPGVYPELTVSENIAVPLATAGKSYSPLQLIRHRIDEERAHTLLELCGLSQKFSYPVGALSHGERQLLEISMVLATDPRIVLLDEPTAGMSVVETENTARLIRRLQNEFSKTVLVIEHDMRFVEQLDCRVAVMLRGRIARTGTYKEIREDPEVINAYLGRAM